MICSHARTLRTLSLLAAVVLAGLLTACGSPTGNAKAPAGVSQDQFQRLLADAAKVTATDFEPVRDRTLTQIAALAKSQAKAGLATSAIEPGQNRLAFGVIDDQSRFLYGRSAVYVARTANSPARGPYPAPADTLVHQATVSQQDRGCQRSREFPRSDRENSPAWSGALRPARSVARRARWVRMR